MRCSKNSPTTISSPTRIACIRRWIRICRATQPKRCGLEWKRRTSGSRAGRKKIRNYPDPQCALIALDPQTGEVKALIGGRNYGMSQLNRILAKRQPGSSFKPFVYAAALNTGLSSSGPVITPATMILDEPTTFYFDGKPYEPSNFEHKFYGNIGRAGRHGALVECGHGEDGGTDRLRPDCGSGAAGGDERGDPSHAGGGAGRL